MIYIIFIFLLLLIFLARKSFSIYYFSPTGFLCVTWIGFTFLMSIFAQEYYFTFESAFYIFLFIVFFFFGEIFNHQLHKKNKSVKKRIALTVNFKKNFENGLIIMGIISIIGAVLYVFVFAEFFGGVAQLLAAGWAVRGAMIEGEIITPFYVKLLLFPGYSNVILALVYYIIYSKIKWYLFIPFIALFVMGVVQVGRAGFMLILFQVYVSLLFVIFYKNYKNQNRLLRENSLIKKSFFLIFVILLVFIGGDMLRTQNFIFNFSSVEIFKTYLFGGISAFATFLKERSSTPIEYGFGRYSFSALYDMFGIAKNEFGVYTTYLRISSTDYTLTTNIFTAFRQYIDDFGILGTCILMFFFGIISNYFFNYAIRGYIKAISVSIVLYTILFHTTLLSVTVHNSILLTLVLPTLLLKLFTLKTKI